METTTNKSIHPLTAIAAISVTLFSLAGIGAITGLIPIGHGQPQTQSQLVARTFPATPAGTTTMATADSKIAEKIIAHKTAAKSVKHVAAANKHVEDRPVEEKVSKYEAPVEVAQNAQLHRAEPARPVCYECGVIESVRAIEKAGDASGLGAAGGGVLGGVLGHQTGAGRGKDVMTVLGAVGGAVAGHMIEKKVKTAKSYEITVRFDDGTNQLIKQDSQPSWHSGDKVKVVNGVITSNS